MWRSPKTRRNILALLCLTLAASGIVAYLFATVSNPSPPNVTLAEGTKYGTRSSTTFILGRAIIVTNQTFGPVQGLDGAGLMNNSLVLTRLNAAGQGRQYSINGTKGQTIVIENWFDTFGTVLNFTSSGPTNAYVDFIDNPTPDCSSTACTNVMFGGATVTQICCIFTDSGGLLHSLVKISCPGSGSGFRYLWPNDNSPMTVYCEVRIHWEQGSTAKLVTTIPTPSPPQIFDGGLVAFDGFTVWKQLSITTTKFNDMVISWDDASTLRGIFISPLGTTAPGTWALRFNQNITAFGGTFPEKIFYNTIQNPGTYLVNISLTTGGSTGVLFTLFSVSGNPRWDLGIGSSSSFAKQNGGASVAPTIAISPNATKQNVLNLAFEVSGVVSTVPSGYSFFLRGNSSVTDDIAYRLDSSAISHTQVWGPLQTNWIAIGDALDGYWSMPAVPAYNPNPPNAWNRFAFSNITNTFEVAVWQGATPVTPASVVLNLASGTTHQITLQWLSSTKLFTKTLDQGAFATLISGSNVTGGPSGQYNYFFFNINISPAYIPFYPMSLAFETATVTIVIGIGHSSVQPRIYETVSVFDFALSADPLTIVVPLQTTNIGRTTIHVLMSGPSTSVNLTCIGFIPSGVSCSFAPASGSISYFSVMTVTLTSSLLNFAQFPSNFATLTVQGTGGTVTHTIGVGLQLAFSSESQRVLFRDDFLYTNPLLESSWTIDQYTNPGSVAGGYTSSGYLNFRANPLGLETTHVTNPVFSTSSYSTATTVKRKMTVAMIPFAKAEANTANIKAGLSPLLATGAYPSTGPSGTPFVDISNNCVSNGGANDAKGTEYVEMDNSGTVVLSTCGDGANNRQVLESGLNPSLYTVFTIETYGISCSACVDNVYAGTAWVWFRVYQEFSNSSIIATTDRNMNFTSNIAPLFQANYAFLSQQNNNAGSTGELSKIDFIQVQSYGSPVCLVVPTGLLCTRLPPVPPFISAGFGFVDLFAYLANLIGYGDEQLGALILFIAVSFGIAGMPYIFTRNILVASEGELCAMGFFVYVGFLPTWVLFMVIIIGATLTVMLVNRMTGGAVSSRIGGGGGIE